MSKVVSDAQYLRTLLTARKMELDRLQASHEIAIAEYIVRSEMLMEQIFSIERHLERQSENDNG